MRVISFRVYNKDTPFCSINQALFTVRRKRTNGLALRSTLLEAAAAALPARLFLDHRAVSSWVYTFSCKAAVRCKPWLGAES
jgi:hypothetical protein